MAFGMAAIAFAGATAFKRPKIARAFCLSSLVMIMTVDVSVRNALSSQSVVFMISWTRSMGARVVMTRRTLLLALVFFLPFLLATCAVPVTVERVDPRSVHRELTANVLTVGEESNASRIVLYRWDLTELFESDPEGALAQLTLRSPAGGPAETSFSLSPSYLPCMRSGPESKSIIWQRPSMPMLCSFRTAPRSPFILSIPGCGWPPIYTIEG